MIPLIKQRHFRRIKMKKQTWLIGFLGTLAITLMITSNSLALDNFVRAYSKSAFINGSPADHTYVTVWGKGYAVANSSTTGGLYVTRAASTTQNINRSIKASGCRLDYMKNGVCHQHSNRLLYYAGTVLPPTVRWYNVSKSLFGVYGDSGPVAGRFSTCKATIK